jgi:hypothetical protein
MSELPCGRKGVPQGQTESGGVVLAVTCGVTRQRGCVVTDLQSLMCLPTFSHFLIVNKNSRALSLPPSLSLSLLPRVGMTKGL